jgi:hypothetical protein
MAVPSMPSETSSENEKWRQIAIRVAGLLAHYWTADDDRATRRAQITDWVKDLEEFPLGAIEGAVMTWRRNERRRPTPADIRKLILPDPKPTDGPAYQPFQPISDEWERKNAKLRKAQAPFWTLLKRVQGGEMTADQFIAERKRLTREMYERDPELREINQLKAEELREPHELERCKGLYKTCSSRYAKLGVVCFEECKAKVPWTGSHPTWR